MTVASVEEPAADRNALFRRVARRFASGVTIVTTRLDGYVYGVTVSAFSTVSIEPLLVMVSVNGYSPILPMVERSKTFAVSILRREQRDVSMYFATGGRALDLTEFPGIATTDAATGAPVIADCLGYFDCHLHESVPGGDHRILIGAVAATGHADGDPLVYYDGDYRSIDQEYT